MEEGTEAVSQGTEPEHEFWKRESQVERENGLKIMVKGLGFVFLLLLSFSPLGDSCKQACLELHLLKRLPLNS